MGWVRMADMGQKPFKLKSAQEILK